MPQNVLSLAGGANRRSIALAAAIGALAGLAAIAAHFVFTVGFPQIVGEVVLGVCIVIIVASRRAQNIAQEKSMRLDAAVNHMSQGLLLFDANERLLLCNRRYIEMYGLSPEIVKPGITLRELLEYRFSTGTFSSDPEKYHADLLAARNHRQIIRNVTEHKDGRTILVINQPMADGGWVATHEDITQSTLAEKEARNAKAFLRTVIENVPATIVVKDAHTQQYILINRAAENFFGIAREAIIGKTARDIFPGDYIERIAEQDTTVIGTNRQLFLDEHPLTTPGNGTRIVTTRKLAIPGADGKPQYLLAVIDDVTERKRAEAKIAYMAHHDDLTGLPNRAAFTAHLEMTLEHAAKNDETFAVFCVDLDRFKGINDVFGHAIGDATLQEIANRLQSASEGAFLARLGGDEFTLIAASPKPMMIDALAERVMAAFDNDFEIQGQRLRVGLSIGVAIYPGDGADVATLLGNADAALYRAKAEGRGVIRFFAADLDLRLRERRALQQDLRLAIERGEFVLHYQPQVRIGGEITGFEALVRWQSPTRGLVPPGKFIPVAEESGLINALGEWILREACREAASWSKPLRIAVNLSPVQFTHGDLPALVHTVLLETGLSPNRLDLEITESVLVGDNTRAIATLRRVKAFGVQVSMDDFGTGYSSLSYLQSFPFDRIKIDQAFISNVERNAQSAAIVRAVIGLGRGLGLPVLAEGVENEAQLTFLRTEGCDEIQGFYFGAAEPIECYANAIGRRRPPHLRIAAAR
jgi:diguanylate cyclase (GGDEF)-like protein/PAS domain S-box-containing protein